MSYHFTAQVYPMPYTVFKYRGLEGVSSSLSRSRLTVTEYLDKKAGQPVRLPFVFYIITQENGKVDAFIRGICQIAFGRIRHKTGPP